ncbi:uncharacterized protein LOC108678074 [Hyalella azteca]|uniref:Uncharacterized protein LOC108678074 n=1 Tax=Hyalella azteca TaxID=294128 RepID=A0A8B7P9P2_HYAAZ|nr:uncharacterized protein LOC108678074 [Hyalella azteca]
MAAHLAALLVISSLLNGFGAADTSTLPPGAPDRTYVAYAADGLAIVGAAAREPVGPPSRAAFVANITANTTDTTALTAPATVAELFNKFLYNPASEYISNLTAKFPQSSIYNILLEHQYINLNNFWNSTEGGVLRRLASVVQLPTDKLQDIEVFITTTAQDIPRVLEGAGQNVNKFVEELGANLMPDTMGNLMHAMPWMH